MLRKRKFLFSVLVFLILFILLFTLLRRSKRTVTRVLESDSLTVILSVTSTKYLTPLIRHFEQYDYITEVIVWNNGSPMQEMQSFKFPIRIVQSKSNLKDLSIFKACNMAKNKYCYYQEPEWNNIFLNSLWKSFLYTKTVTHAISPPGIFWETRKCTFYNRSTANTF
jgi:hypothetical protein